MNYFSKQDVYDILQIVELSMKGYDENIKMEDINFGFPDVEFEANFYDIEDIFNEIKDNEGSPIEGNPMLDGPMEFFLETGFDLGYYSFLSSGNDINIFFDNRILLDKYLKNLCTRLDVEKFQVVYLSYNDSIVEIKINNISDEIIEEGLPRQSTVNQLKRLRKLTKSTDIGDRVTSNKLGNLIDDSNPISRVESYEAFTKKNKSFTPGWNTKGMISPFKNK
jgi:hypothetical protein